jgi:hypothetical protein
MESTVSRPARFISPQRVSAALPACLAAGVIYPLAVMLALAVSVILATHLSVLAIAEWGEW